MRRLRRSSGLAQAFATMASVFMLGAAATATSQDANPCLECHDTVHVATAPPHGDLGCDECHADIAEGHEKLTADGVDALEICSGCHAKQAAAIERSVHAKEPGCSGCHGSAHAISLMKDPASPMFPREQVRACGHCHDEPASLVDGYAESVHGRGLLLSGLVNAPSCSDCHGSHAIYAKSDERSKIARAKIPQTCGRCHEFLLNDWLEGSAHGTAFKEGREGPVCTTCHSSHRISEPLGELARHKFPQACGDCHGSPYASYRDSFHGKASDLGFVTTAICSDCHTPHANLPKDDRRASIHPSNLQATCGKCHGNVTASFVTFDPHSNPRDRERDPRVHFIWLAMTALLLGTFGFFGLHDALWLQRTVVAALRGELHAARANDGPYIRRFTPMQVKMHVVVVLTFLTLAATGLPLKFHFTPWARTLADWLGGVGSANTIHRLAALATFGYFLVHVIHVALRAFVRKEAGLFWGWKSLVPRWEDVCEFAQNVRYFLYIGPRPRFDRWSYWEKFDYFAVFWGVAIIGASGLMMWFPGFFTRFLPGWTLNAALVVHSDEALLATCFIFVFHFFHTHLRPESFPLDPVVFTGVMPLERFREERPAEHARLVERGMLEAAIVPAPTQSQIRFARVFGFSALFVGLALVAGILWGLLVPR